MPVLIGTSGWQYAHWRGRLYPRGLPTRRWLEHYAERFATVEVNATFYRLPRPATVEDWARRTPPDFVVAAKASRFLTHVRRLREPAEPVRRLMGVLEPLGDRLGAVLLQLPPDMRRDIGALDGALRCFPAGVRIAVEPRHPSWFDDATRGLLERRGAALCMADRPDGAPRRGGRHPGGTCACTRAAPPRGLATAVRRCRRGPPGSRSASAQTTTSSSS